MTPERQAGRALPTTFESIEVVALQHPGRLALVEGGQGWTYGHLYLSLVRLGCALQRLGVQRGQRVAVSRPGFGLQLALLIACENVGAVSSPFQGRDDVDAPALFAMVDWVLSETPQDCPPGVRFQLLDEAFFQQAMASDAQRDAAHPRIALEPHEPQRITRTSGSSGRSKFMLLQRGTHEYWIRACAANAGYTAATRLLLLGPLVIYAAFVRACGCLRIGAAVLALPGDRLQGVEITHVWALPLRLQELLDELPPGFQCREGVAVNTSGGFVSAALKQRLQLAFGGGLVNRYGANETGPISEDLDETGAGVLAPGVDLRIVDDAGRDLPAGETGIIVVRTPSMALGYIDAPPADQAAFRDGWFHSGDLGALVGPRRLRLSGRHDDLLNVGGIKIPAARIEEQIRQLVPVRDCAVLAVNPGSTGATVGIAMVLEPGTPPDAAIAKLQGALELGANTVARVIVLDALPRLAGAKLDRVALHRLFAN